MIKYLYLLTLFLFNICLVHGATYVVSNFPGATKDFSSIQTAIEFAASGDTILVKGSPTNYGNVLLEKPIVLIGEGFSDDNPSGHTSKLTRILFTSNPYRRTISSGSTIIGFEFPFFPGHRPNIITVANQRVKIEDITIERNWFWFVEVIGQAESWVFRNNVIRGWIDGGSQGGDPEKGGSGFVFENNILNSVYGFHRGEVIPQNNVILGRLRDISNAQVSHNIFTREDYILEKVYGSRFDHNVAIGTIIGSKHCYDDVTTFEANYLCEGKANSGTGNLTGTDPGFAYWPGDDIQGGGVFQLSQSSPARRNDNDADQAGIFGGLHPFPVDLFINPEIENPFPSFVTSIY